MFEVVGIDFAGPVRYRKSAKSEGKAYLAIFACSLSRATHLELVRNLEMSTCIMCLKKYMARCGLAELMLDIEIQINRRPLSYVEDDLELTTLTPATFLYQRSSLLPVEETWRIESNDLRKRAKYLLACKNGLWKREYLAALRERQNMLHERSKFHPKVGDVVIVQSDSKNLGTWPLAVVAETYTGRDGVLRAVHLKMKNGAIERPVQHLYPMELS